MSSQVRSEVMDMYDGPAWKERVSRMPDRQVYAIYRSNQARQEKKRQQLALATKNPQPVYKQLTIWDYLEGLS